MSGAHAPARAALERRFASCLVVRQDLNRRLVSYQANRAQPGLRWFKYKEGFSAALARDALDLSHGPVLDPFAGLGTSAHCGARCTKAPFRLSPLLWRRASDR